jgi:hypothetical protein
VLTLRGVSYYLNAHLHKWADGQWHIGEEGRNDYERRQSAHITRCDWKKTADMYPSHSAAEKIRATIEAAVNAYVKDHPEILTQAQAEHLRAEFVRADAEYTTAWEAAGKARDAREAAKAAMENFLSGDWESRVQALENEGLTRSDAQAVVDAQDLKVRS